MRSATIVAVGLLIAVSSVSHAEISTRLVVMFGVKLTVAQAKAAHAMEAQLDKQGIKLFDDPSMTGGNAPVPMTTYAGRVMSSDLLVRNKPSSSTTSLPTTGQLDALRKELRSQGWSDDVKVISLVVYAGGK